MVVEPRAKRREEGVDLGPPDDADFLHERLEQCFALRRVAVLDDLAYVCLERV